MGMGVYFLRFGLLGLWEYTRQATWGHGLDKAYYRRSILRVTRMGFGSRYSHEETGVY